MPETLSSNAVTMFPSMRCEDPRRDLEGNSWSFGTCLPGVPAA
jgi:hypothetical protein